MLLRLSIFAYQFLGSLSTNISKFFMRLPYVTRGVGRSECLNNGKHTLVLRVKQNQGQIAPATALSIFMKYT